jgi:uncharacterized membrane protein
MPELVLPSWFGPFAARPRLVAAFILGLAAAAASQHLLHIHVSTAAIIGWDVLCLSYVAIMVFMFGGSTPDEMRISACQDDEGRATILTLMLVAVVTAVVAVALELSLAKNAHGVERPLRVALAFATVAASWFMVHLIFAVHYAHGYYDRDDGKTDAQGLAFPGGEEPDYWDFLYFSLIIGVAGQTADVSITRRQMRRLNTVHAVFSFAFNTVIVALTINLLAGLFS